MVQQINGGTPKDAVDEQEDEKVAEVVQPQRRHVSEQEGGYLGLSSSSMKNRK